MENYTAGCGCAACMKAHADKAHADNSSVTYSQAARAQTSPHQDVGITPYYAQAITGEYTWGKQIVTYTFNATQGHFDNNGGTNYTTLNAAQQRAVERVLAEYEKVTNITFREVESSNPSSADMVFRQANLPDNLAGWAFSPSDELGSDITFSNRYDGTATGRNAEYYGIEPGQFGFRLMMHEIGHAMGLIHPFEGSVVLPDIQDSQNSTVMSYNGSDQNAPPGGYVGGAVATRSGPFAPQTLMLYDIAAIQSMYGANHSYNAGNTTYRMSGDTDVFTLWDGAGVDTIDSSGYAGTTAIDLREGLSYVSHIGDTSFWNAFGANIENATGGAGADTITGNALGNRILGNRGNDIINGAQGNDSISGGKNVDILTGGDGSDWLNGNNANDRVTGDAGDDLLRGGKDNDTLLGGVGNDTLFGDLGNDLLSGGAGSDVFVFNIGSGLDTINDFQDGVDKLHILGYSLNSDTVGAALSSVGGNAVVALGQGASVTLTGISASLLGADDFIFG